MESENRIKTLQELILETLSTEDIIIHVLKLRRRSKSKCWHVTDLNYVSLNFIDFSSRCRNGDIVNTLLKFTSLLNTSPEVLYHASKSGVRDIDETLKQSGADIYANTDKKDTEFNFASDRKDDIVDTLSKLNMSHGEKFSVLQYASYLGCTNIVETLVRSGADINAQSSKKNTALHLASKQGNDKIVEILIKNGAELNILNETGQSAISLAVEANTNGCLNALIRAGADLNLPGGYTALHCACLSKKEEKVKALIEAGAIVNIANMFGSYPLHILLCMHICDDAKYQVVQKITDLLIDAKTDINLKDKHGYTALHHAAMMPDKVQLIEKLILAGADVNDQNDIGDTALHLACTSNVQVLNDAETATNIDSKSVDSAFHYAVQSQINDSVKTLIESGIEINKQNNSGHTALHLIFNTSNFEVFENLMINGASLTIKDNIGKDPLYYFIVDNFLSAFKLNHHFKSYRDVCGNTIFHLFIQKCKKSDEKIWKLIREKRSELSYYLSEQNIFGQTPLHIAVIQNQEILVFIFSEFGENLHGLLLCDEYGNTFLHDLVNSRFFMQSENLKSFFLKILLENEYKNCSSKTTKDLLKSKNRVGNTPLHLFIKNASTSHDFEYSELVFELFLFAGANINLRNSFGETALHLLLSAHWSYELAKTAIEKGSQVNVRNIFGESEIFKDPYTFESSSIDYLEFLEVSGFDMSICNNFGQTAVMSHFKDMFFRNVKCINGVLGDKVIICKHDNFGSNLLHYIAWKEENERFFNPDFICVDLVPMLKCPIVKDKQGQLPCDVAFLRGHANILKQICVCKNEVHKQEPIFYYRHLLINSLKEKDEAFKKCVHSLSKYCLEDNIRNIINIPFLGLVRINEEVSDVLYARENEELKTEADEVKSAITDFVSYICRRLGEKDKLLHNQLVLSGSVAENTKIGLPDEFDFICLLDRMSELLYVEHHKTGIHVKLQKMYREDVSSRFFDPMNNVLIASKFVNRIFDILNEVLHESGTYSHRNIIFVKNGFRKPEHSPNFKLKLRWCCCKYKDITVKIDIVPAFKIHCPSGANLFSDRFNPTTNNGEFVMVKFIDTEMLGDMKTKGKGVCSVTSFIEENTRISALSSEARDAYVISKILCRERVCPSVTDVRADVNYRKDYKKSQCFTIISRYMLKNCLFYVVDELKKKSNSNLPVTVHTYVCKIFQKLLQFANKGNFPCYMLPNIDLFTNDNLVFGEGNQACKVRAMYVKLILNILGKNVDFDDINLQTSLPIPKIPNQFDNFVFTKK